MKAALVVTVTLLAVGCAAGRITRLDDDGAPGAAGDGTVSDGGQRDVSRDTLQPDLPANDPFHDLRPDHAPQDLRPDQAAVDLRADQAAVDLRADQAAVDLRADQAAVDLRPDLAKVGPCATGGTVVKTYADPTMVVCGFPTGTNQCEAATRCTGTWHMCTAAEYQARGGASEAHSTFAWIAACIRTHGKNHAPSVTPCASCTASYMSSTATLAWRCSVSSSTGNNTANVGVATWRQCFQVGLKDPANAAFWAPREAYKSDVQQVTCCK